MKSSFSVKSALKPVICSRQKKAVNRFLLLPLLGILLPVSNITASDYGTTGLIDIPTARFDEDGTLAVSVSRDDRHRQFSITYQATPWLQTTFRYSGFNQFFHWDRNYELKARLWEEELYLPQVAVGFRDIVGTGIYGSEYIVASKQIGKTDVTLGLGWGRLAGKGDLKNPLRAIDDRFATRSANVGLGGELSLGNFFSGSDVGFFGGISHAFDDIPLSAKIEYNPDRYDWDVSRGGQRPTSPWSVGFTWQGLEDLDLSLSLQHGDEIGIGFRSYLDTISDPAPKSRPDFISSYYLSPSALPPQIKKNRWYDRLLYDVERSGLFLISARLSHDGTTAQLVVGNASYPLWADAIGQLTSLADLHLPATVRSIHFVTEEAGHRSATITVPRPSATPTFSTRTTLRRVQILSGREIHNPEHRTSFRTGKINTTVNFRTKLQLFDPDDPARYQIYADVASEYTLNNNWAVRSSIAIDLFNNFDESRRQKSSSVLPKVRSDIVRYLIDGESGLERLIIEGRGSIERSLHYKVFGGYLETMFAGIGGELLFWPTRSRVGVGLSLAHARQRDFNRGFNLRNYGVTTGHISAYWATPFYNYDVAVHAGRYLAKDVGATFEVRRTFRSGWQVGVWATLTDVPFDEFGEGSFDKGLFFKIPLDGLFGSSTRSQFGTRLRPIQRDGGQRLDGYSGDIFWDLRSARFDAFKLDTRLLP